MYVGRVNGIMVDFLLNFCSVGECKIQFIMFTDDKSEIKRVKMGALAFIKRVLADELRLLVQMVEHSSKGKREQFRDDPLTIIQILVSSLAEGRSLQVRDQTIHKFLISRQSRKFVDVSLASLATVARKILGRLGAGGVADVGSEALLAQDGSLGVRPVGEDDELAGVLVLLALWDECPCVPFPE